MCVCVCVCVLPASWPFCAPIGLASHLRPKWILNSNPPLLIHTHTCAHTHFIGHSIMTSIIYHSSNLATHTHTSPLNPLNCFVCGEFIHSRTTSRSENKALIVVRIQTHFCCFSGFALPLSKLCHNSCWFLSSSWCGARKQTRFVSARLPNYCVRSSADNRSEVCSCSGEHVLGKILWLFAYLIRRLTSLTQFSDFFSSQTKGASLKRPN